MDPGSDVPEWSYGSSTRELDAYADDDEFAAQLEACLLHSPGEAAEVIAVADLGDYATTMTGSEPSDDDLEGSIINIFQPPSAEENGVVDDILFADFVQSCDDHVDDVGMLELFSELIGIDDWTRASDVAECSRRSSSKRKRNYSEADLTCSMTLNLKAGATVLTAFGDRWSDDFGGSAPSVDYDIRWLEEDDEEPHECEWHVNNYSFSAAMISAMSPDNEEKASATSDASCSGECSGSSTNNHEAPLDWEEMMVDYCLPEVHREHQRSAPKEPHEYEWHVNNYSFSAAMISAMSPDNEEKASAASDASCSGECSGSSTNNHEVPLDLEEMMMVDYCLPEAHREHQRSTAPCDINAVHQCSSSENAAPRQCAGIIIREKVAVDVSAPKKYRGVVYNINSRKWEAHVWDPSKVQKQDAASRGSKRVKAGVQIYLGQYHTCEEAGAVHDKAAIKLGLTHDNKCITNLGKYYARPSYPLNFPVEAYEVEVLEHQDWSVRDYLWKLRKCGLGFSRGTSGMKGVSRRKKLNKFEARYSFKDGGVKREFHLGLFDDAEMAARHYDLALLSFKGEDAITNLRPSLYSDLEVKEYRRHLLERSNC